MTDQAKVEYDDEALAVEVAATATAFVDGVRDLVGKPTENSVTALPYLLLTLGQVVQAGGRLGAHDDFIPDERFEADAGPDPDLEDIRVGLARLMEDLDEHAAVFDPYGNPPEITVFRISDDVTTVCGELLHGLAHFNAGRTTEALWWWQFSYLSAWGSAAITALRAVQSLIAHSRFDADDSADDPADLRIADQVTRRLRG